MNIVMVSSIFTFVIVAVTYWFMPYATPKSVQFGVRIPPSREHDDSINRLRASYHIGLLSASVPVFLLTILLPALFQAYFYSIFSMVFELVVAFLNYYRINRKLRALKRREEWYKDLQEGASVTYDYSKRRTVKYDSLLAMIPAMVVIIITIYIGVTVYPTLPALIPTHFNSGGQPNQFSHKTPFVAFMLVFMQIGLTAMMFLIGYVITRTRQEIDVSRQKSSYEQQEEFKVYTRDALYLFAGIINVTMLCSSLNIWKILPPGDTLLFTLFPTLIGTFVLVFFFLYIGQMGSNIKVSVKDDTPSVLSNRNDDKYWKAGSIYYNRDDPALLVGKRFGVGWTMNFAHPITWTIFGAIILLPIITILAARHLL